MVACHCHACNDRTARGCLSHASKESALQEKDSAGSHAAALRAQRVVWRAGRAAGVAHVAPQVDAHVEDGRVGLCQLQKTRSVEL